jgi:hypothetical protein
MLLEDRPPAGCSSEARACSGHGPWKSECATRTARAATSVMWAGRQKPLPAVGQARSTGSDFRECSGLRRCLSAKTRPVTARTRRTPRTAVAAFSQNGVSTAAPFEGTTSEAGGTGSCSIAVWATVVATMHQVAAPTSMAIKRLFGLNSNTVQLDHHGLFR